MKAIIVLSALLTTWVPALEPGAQIQLTIRGVNPEEQQKVSGNYRVGESGNVRLPLLDDLVQAKGLTAEQFARTAEAAYRKAGIYSRPAIEVETVENKIFDNQPVVSVGGQVRRAGETAYRKNLTVLQAIDAAGGRNEFGGKNLLLFREGKQYCLDYGNIAHKNIILKPGDSLQVEQKGVVDRWKGNDDRVKTLLK